jgi:hypothetical protein
MALLGGASGLAGVLLEKPLGVADTLGPSIVFGVLMAAYLRARGIWSTPRLAGVVAASIGGFVIASFLGVVSGFFLSVLLAPPVSAPTHPLALAPGGLVYAGLLSLVVLTSLPTKQADLTLEIGGCSIVGAVLGVIGGSAAAGFPWHLQQVVAAAIWNAGMAFVLALAVEIRTATAPSTSLTSLTAEPTAPAVGEP